MALQTGHCDGAGLAALDPGQRRRRRRHHERRLAAHHRGHAGPAAAIRQMRDVEAARHGAEQLDRQMLRAALPGRRIAQRAGLGLGELDQFLQRFDRKLRVDDHDVRRRTGEPDRREILDRIVRQLGIKPRIDAVRRNVGEQQRVAVGRRLGGQFRAEQPAGARTVVDDDLLVDLGADVLRQQPPHCVGRAADRLRDDDPDDLLLGILLSRNRRGHDEHPRNQDKKERGIWLASLTSPHSWPNCWQEPISNCERASGRAEHLPEQQEVWQSSDLSVS